MLGSIAHSQDMAALLIAAAQAPEPARPGVDVSVRADPRAVRDDHAAGATGHEAGAGDAEVGQPDRAIASAWRAGRQLEDALRVSRGGPAPVAASGTARPQSRSITPADKRRPSRSNPML